MAKEWETNERAPGIIYIDGVGVAKARTNDDAQKIVESHNRLVHFIREVEWSSFHGCFTGDCPHEKDGHRKTCIDAIRNFHEGIGRFLKERS